MATLFVLFSIILIQTHFKGETYYKVNYVIYQSLQIWTKVGFLAGRYIPWERDLTKHPSGVSSFETLSSGHARATSVVSC
jgi:hypothetical protein